MWSKAIAEQLRRRGFDVVSVSDTLRSASDTTLLAAARTDERVILTRNVDDFRVFAADALINGDGHAGVILIASRAFPERGARPIGNLIRALDVVLRDAPDLSNRVCWLSPDGHLSPDS